MAMDVREIVHILAVANEPIVASKLTVLSALDGDDLILFKRAWPDIPPERRRQAVDLMAEMAEDNVDMDFTPIFRYSLDDKDDNVRAAAVQGLWDVDERSLIGPLIGLLANDSSELVRSAAAQALGRYALLAEVGKLLERDRARIGDALLSVVDDDFETFEVRRRAVEAVAAMNLPRVPEIIQEAYESEMPEVRVSALFAMGRSCDPRWLADLLVELDSDDASMRYEAAGALGEIGQSEAIVNLIPLIEDEDTQVQEAVILALGSIGGSLSKRALTKARESDDPRVSELAQEALQNAELADNPFSDLGT